LPFFYPPSLYRKADTPKIGVVNDVFTASKQILGGGSFN